MTQTKVVHVNSPEWAQALNNGTAVYIGRRFGRFAASWYGNPFFITKSRARTQAIAEYEDWMRRRLKADKQMRVQIQKLEHMTLGCWCAPEACHGDVLKKLAEMSEQEYQAWLAAP